MVKKVLRSSQNGSPGLTPLSLLTLLPSASSSSFHGVSKFPWSFLTESNKGRGVRAGGKWEGLGSIRIAPGGVAVNLRGGWLGGQNCD